jgi:phosphoribosylglycinamide formyltransferase-1
MSFETLNVAVLTSRRAPGLEGLLRHPMRGRLFNVTVLITSELSFPQTRVAERADVPVLVHPLRTYCDDRKVSIRDRAERRDYDAATADMLTFLGIDTVLLLGYTYVLTEPMLCRFPRRILNIHDSDLTICRPDGTRRYTGLRSTREAIVAGEHYTRSTAHLVTAELDGGPIITMSEPYSVPRIALAAAERGDMSVIKPCAWMHRQAMMNDWGELAVRALEYLSAGALVEEEEAIA